MLRASADVLRADIDLSGHELAARDTSLFAGRTSDPYVIFKQEDAQVLSTRTEHSSGACASSGTNTLSGCHCPRACALRLIVCTRVASDSSRDKPV